MKIIPPQIDGNPGRALAMKRWDKIPKELRDKAYFSKIAKMRWVKHRKRRKALKNLIKRRTQLQIIPISQITPNHSKDA